MALSQRIRRHGAAVLGPMLLLGGLAVANGHRPTSGVLRASLAAATSDDWTMFHQGQSHTGVSPDTTWGASTVGALKVKWQQLVGGGSQGKAAVLASPVVAFNATLARTVVYDVSSLGVTHAFDAATGATVWTQSLGSAVIDSPALDGNSIYVGTGQGQLFALDATTGAIQCSFQLPIVPPELKPGGILSSPVVGHIDGSGPIVFFGDVGQELKVNAGHEWAVTGFGNTAGNCQLKWSFNGWANKGAHGNKTGSWSPPALTKDRNGNWTLVFGSSDVDDSVYALDASTGTLRWRFQTQKLAADEDVGAGPTIGAPGLNGFPDGVVYIDGKDKIEYALDLSNGNQIWSFDMRADAGLKNNSVSTAALVGNNVVVAYSGYVYDFDATTGSKVWRSATRTATMLSSPAISGAPGDQVVVIGDLAGVFHGYRLSDGAQALSLNIHHKMLPSPAIADGMVFVAASNGVLYALG